MVLGKDMADLGSRRLSWRDLLIIVKHSPANSAFKRSFAGDDADWTLSNHLLAGVFDLLASANWQRAGDEKVKRPEPLKRPGMSGRVDGDVMARGKPVTTDQMDALLGWNKE